MGEAVSERDTMGGEGGLGRGKYSVFGVQFSQKIVGGIMRYTMKMTALLMLLAGSVFGQQSNNFPSLLTNKLPGYLTNFAACETNFIVRLDIKANRDFQLVPCSVTYGYTVGLGTNSGAKIDEPFTNYCVRWSTNRTASFTFEGKTYQVDLNP